LVVVVEGVVNALKLLYGCLYMELDVFSGLAVVE
jgi:hypothetical protein